jgi:hypothetical protein
MVCDVTCRTFLLTPFQPWILKLQWWSKCPNNTNPNIPTFAHKFDMSKFHEDGKSLHDHYRVHHDYHILLSMMSSCYFFIHSNGSTLKTLSSSCNSRSIVSFLLLPLLLANLTMYSFPPALSLQYSDTGKFSLKS